MIAVFATGKSADEIRQSLGAPDRINKQGANERWIYGCMAIDFANGKLFSTIDLRGYQAELQRSPIRLGFRPDPSLWRAKRRHMSRLTSTTEYEAVAANEAAWTLLTQRLFGKVSQHVSPRKWMEQARRESVPRQCAYRSH